MTVLVIEFTQKELEKVKGEITDQQTKLQSLMSKTDLNKLKNELKEMTEKYTHELRRYKLKTFKRDTTDYQEDMVYPWLARRPWASSKARRSVRGANTSDSSISDFPSDSDCDFLDHTAPRGRLYPAKTKRNPGAGAGGAGRTTNRPATRGRRM